VLRAQLHGKRRAISRLARGLDAPAVGLHDGFADREAEAAVAGGAGLVGAVETPEDVRQVLSGNAGTGIADGECGGAVVALFHDADFAAVVVVADGVAKEVRDDLRDGPGVAEDDARAVALSLPPPLKKIVQRILDDFGRK